MSDVLGLFEGYGIEIEYMIVATADLAVAPLSDVLLARAGGALSNEIERGAACWSNELALHVIEFKSNGPLESLDGAAELFAAQVADANALLAEQEAMLLPTGMHPWMDPHAEMRLWPHDDDRIYRAFHRIFDCRGHGWANLQSVHINLPFDSDAAFARLHAAIRVLLPVLPALAASTPLMDGRDTRVADNRLQAYEKNCARIPSVTGRVIPEPVFTMTEYQDTLLAGLYRDIAPHDPNGTLQEEWLNARGAIARFDRMALEIRLLDVQECPRADLAVVEVVAETVRALTDELWSTTASQRSQPVAPLKALLDRCITAAEDAVIDHRDYLRLLGWQKSSEATARQLWEHLVESAAARNALSTDGQRVLEHYLRHGTLATRLRGRAKKPTREQLQAMYQDMADCLADGQLFT